MDTTLAGPINRGVTRCPWAYPEGGTCCAPLEGCTPKTSVVALCGYHVAKAMPMGSAAEMRAEYARLLSLYGWKPEVAG
jgi:hypothetical protein